MRFFRNDSHEFDDGLRGAGNIGPLLNMAKRKALIEYLKTQ